MLVRLHVLLHPAGKVRIGFLPACKAFPALGAVFEGGRREVGGDCLNVGFRQLQLGVLQRRELDFDLTRQLLGTGFVHEDLDARLVLVVATAMQVVHAHDRRGVGQQILFRQEVADLLGDHRRAALATADIDGKADAAVLVLL
ncbi:hypothetical protein D9M70_539150 [compost metagenome]